jgi:hypothetical protein
MLRARKALAGIAAVAALAATGVIAMTAIQATSGSVAESDQPIAFPHDLHAGTNNIPCMYCHYSADKSVDAGIPAVQVCAGCHLQPNGTPWFRADSVGIRQIAAYWQQGIPIPWVRIYDLPDHVHFPHMRHVKAGLACQECHGPVEEMRVIEKYSSLQMGWCIDCHRTLAVRTDCTVCHY